MGVDVYLAARIMFKLSPEERHLIALGDINDQRTKDALKHMSEVWKKVDKKSYERYIKEKKLLKNFVISK